MEMLECIRLDGGRFDILNGFDEMLLCGMAVRRPRRRGQHL